MIIRELEKYEDSRLVSVSAKVVHEVPIVREQVITFSVPRAFGQYLALNFEAFLISAAPVALFHGETRIKVEGDVCPELLDRLRAGLLLQQSWFGTGCDVPTITSTGDNLEPRNGTATACFLSGGVDSLSLLGRNLQLYPVGHENRVVAGIFVYGLDIGDPNKPARHDVFEKGVQAFRTLEALHQIEVVPCTTNVRDLEPNWQFYESRHLGFALSGIAHSLGAGFSRTLVALDNRVDNHLPWGNHPILSKYVSSSVLRFESYLDGYSRLEKYEFLINLSGALDVLRVCYTMEEIGESQLNCGKCEKCTRTKLELFAYGALEKCSTFPDKTIDLDRVRALDSSKHIVQEFHNDLIRSLTEHGSQELVDALIFSVSRTRGKGASKAHLKNAIQRARRKAKKLLS